MRNKQLYFDLELLEQRFLWKNSNGNAVQVVEKDENNDPNIDTKIGNMDILQDKDKFISEVDYLLTKGLIEKQRKFDVLGGVENAVGGKEKIMETVKKKMKKSATHAFGSLLKKIAVIGAGLWLTSKVVGAVRSTIGKIFGFGDKASSGVTESKDRTFGSIFKLMMGAGAVFGVYKLVKDNVSFTEIGVAYAADGKIGVAKLFGEKIKNGSIKMTKELGIALKGLAKYLGIPLATFGMVDSVKKKVDVAKVKLKAEMEKRKKSGEKTKGNEKERDYEVVPLSTHIAKFKSTVTSFAGQVTEWTKQHKESIIVLGFLGLGVGGLAKTAANAAKIGVGTLKSSAASLARLSKLPFKTAVKFPMTSFFGAIAIFKFMASLDDKEILLPKSEKDFEKWWSERLKDSRVEQFMMDNHIAPPKTLEDFKMILYGKSDDVEKRMMNALKNQDYIDVAVDYVGLSDVELIKRAQLDGLERAVNINNMEYRKSPKSRLRAAFVSLIHKLNGGGFITISDIVNLKKLADDENFLFEKTGDVFVLTKLDDAKIAIEGKSINICPDPSYSEKKQAEISKSFMAIPNPFQACSKTMINEAKSRVNSAAEVMRNDGGATIVVKGGYAYLMTGLETKVLAPFSVFKSLASEVFLDEKFNYTKVLTPYGAGLVPAVIFNYGKNLVNNKGIARILPHGVIWKSLAYPINSITSAFKHVRLDVWPALRTGDFSRLMIHTRTAGRARLLSKFFAARAKVPFMDTDLFDDIAKKNDVLGDLYDLKSRAFGKGNKALERINNKLPHITGLNNDFTNPSEVENYINRVKQSLEMDMLVRKHSRDIAKDAELYKEIQEIRRSGKLSDIEEKLTKKGIISPGKANLDIRKNPKTGKVFASVDLSDIEKHVDDAKIVNFDEWKKNHAKNKISVEIDTKLSPEKMEKAEKGLADELGKNKNVEKKLLSKNIFKSPKVVKLYANMKKIVGPSFAAWIVYQSLTSKTPQRDIAQDIIMGAGGFATIKLLSSKPEAILSKKRAILGLLVLTGTILDACGFSYGTNFINAKLDNFGNYMLDGDKVPLNEFYGGVLNLTTSGGMLTRLISKKIAKRFGKKVEENVAKKVGQKIVKEVVEDGTEAATKRALFKGLGKRIGKSVAEKIAKVAGKDVLEGIAKRFATAATSSVVPVAGWIVGGGMLLWTAYDAYEIYDIINRGRTINKVLEKRSKKHIKKFKFVEGQSEVERALRSKMLQDGADSKKVSKMSFDMLVETAAAIPGSGNKSLLENIYEGLQSVKVQMIREGDGAGDYEEYHFNAGQIIGVSVSENGEVTKMGGKDFDAKIELPPNLNFDPKRFEKVIDYNEPDEEIVPAIAIFLQIAQAETHWNKMLYKVKNSKEIVFTRSDNGRSRTIRREGNSWHVDGLNRDFTLFQAMAIANLINYLPKLDDVGEHDAGSKRPFEEDDGALDFDVNWNPNDLEILGVDGNAAKFYKKVGLGMGLVADLMNDAYVGGLI